KRTHRVPKCPTMSPFVPPRRDSEKRTLPLQFFASLPLCDLCDSPFPLQNEPTPPDFPPSSILYPLSSILPPTQGATMRPHLTLLTLLTLAPTAFADPLPPDLPPAPTTGPALCPGAYLTPAQGKSAL